MYRVYLFTLILLVSIFLHFYLVPWEVFAAGPQDYWITQPEVVTHPRSPQTHVDTRAYWESYSGSEDTYAIQQKAVHGISSPSLSGETYYSSPASHSKPHFAEEDLSKYNLLKAKLMWNVWLARTKDYGSFSDFIKSCKGKPSFRRVIWHEIKKHK
jgi:hypothetical protein